MIKDNVNVDQTSATDKILYCSWGYSMTLVDYAKIIGETPKSVRCVLIQARVENDCGRGEGKAYPEKDNVVSEPFLLRKKVSKDGSVYYKGSYPFATNSKRMGFFNEYKGGGKYYNSWD